MCEPGIHIKLCTCAADEIDEYFCWQLLRKDPGPYEILVGKILDPTLDEYGKNLEQNILNDLNTHNVFDFDFIPKNGDVLVITYRGIDFAFKFYNRKYTLAPVDYSFSHTLEISTGKIEQI